METLQELVEMLQEFAPQIIVVAITAIITSLITYWFALRRFYSEKWWEKKNESYDAILESLHYIARDFDEEMHAAITGVKISEDRKEEYRKKRREAQDELAKRMDIGQFVISDKAVAALAEFQKEFASAENTRDWGEFLDGSIAATSKALQQMRDAAKRDLKGWRLKDGTIRILRWLRVIK